MTILEKVHSQYCINRSSIIPSDYCYNMTNKGKQANKKLNDFKILLSIKHGEYKYVGENYQYSQYPDRTPDKSNITRGVTNIDH